MVVWIPMLDSDTVDSAHQATSIVAAGSVRQFWDGQKLAGKIVARSVGQPDRIAWDVYLFYDGLAEWTHAGPTPPVAALAQTAGVVVASPGALPAAADQSRLPAFLKGRAIVVGDSAHLPELLGKVAARFQSHRD